MVRLTEPEGSVVRPNLAEPPSSADTDADADSSVVQHSNLIINKLYKGEKLKKNGHSFQDVKGDTKNEESQFFSNTFIFVENLQLGNASPHF